MKILNVGPLELFLVFILMIVILGPDDMVNIARRLGRTVYRITHSELFRSIVKTAQEIRQIPGKFIEETGLDETVAQLKTDAAEISKEMSDLGIDEAVDELKDTASDVTTELNKTSQELAESSKIKDIQANPSKVQEAPVSLDSSKNFKASEKETKNKVAKPVQQPDKTQSIKPVVIQEQKSALKIPAIKLSFTETSFDNDFHFSEKVYVQSWAKKPLVNTALLERTESLVLSDEERTPVQ